MLTLILSISSGSKMVTFCADFEIGFLAAIEKSKLPGDTKFSLLSNSWVWIAY